MKAKIMVIRSLVLAIVLTLGMSPMFVDKASSQSTTAYVPKYGDVKFDGAFNQEGPYPTLTPGLLYYIRIDRFNGAEKSTVALTLRKANPTPGSDGMTGSYEYKEVTMASFQVGVDKLDWTAPTSLTPGQYHFVASINGTSVAESKRFVIEGKATTSVTPVTVNIPPPPPQQVQVEDDKLKQRIQQLEYKISELENKVVDLEKKLVTTTNNNLIGKMKGRILLQVENNGEAWYVDPATYKKYYLKDGNSSYTALGAFGLGIRNADLAKIPVGIESRFQLQDTDGDGLDDKLEKAVGTDPSKADTDGDGHSDGDEVKKGYNPAGAGTQQLDTASGNKLKGRILLQVENGGQAWYVSPVDGKRYYMADGELAYQIMRYLSLGITNTNLRQIPVGEFR